MSNDAQERISHESAGSTAAWALLCACSTRCGDDGDVDGPGTCKGLPLPPREPLVEIVLVERGTK